MYGRLAAICQIISRITNQIHNSIQIKQSYVLRYQVRVGNTSRILYLILQSNPISNTNGYRQCKHQMLQNINENKNAKI